jgi:hypothetical protein
VSEGAAWDRLSEPDSLHLAQCNLVLCPIVRFGRSRRLMPSHLLGSVATLQVSP